LAAFVLPLAALPDVVGGVMPKVVNSVVTQLSGNFFNESSVAISTCFQQRFCQKARCALPSGSSFHVGAVANELVTSLIRGIPKLFEQAARKGAAAQGGREPSELSVRTERRASHHRPSSAIDARPFSIDGARSVEIRWTNPKRARRVTSTRFPILETSILCVDTSSSNERSEMPSRFAASRREYKSFVCASHMWRVCRHRGAWWNDMKTEIIPGFMSADRGKVGSLFLTLAESRE
jgi:hypothetical protein